MTPEGYPDETELARIREWPWRDPQGLIEFVSTLWRYKGNGDFHRRGSLLRLHTFGWSGNEELIAALQQNTMFWMISWRASWRGGHYSFEIREIKD